MFWALLATAIMAYSGEGDDTKVFRDFNAALQAAVAEYIAEPARREEAIGVLNDYMVLFKEHRARLNTFQVCLHQVDGTYTATTEDYYKCTEGVEDGWTQTEARYIELQRQQKAAIKADEWTKIEAKVLEAMK